MEINKVYQMDNLEFMRSLELSKDGFEGFDLIIADPPYYKVVKEDWDNQWENEQEYINWCISWINEAVRILKPNGSIVVWGQLGEKFITFAGLLWEIQKQIPSLHRKNVVTVKRTKGQGTNTNFMSNREEFVWYVKDKKNYIFNKQYTTEAKQQYGYKGNKTKPNFKVAGNVWSDIIYPWFGSKVEKYVNTAQKPLQSCDRIIDALSNENDLVYIPFGGSGSEIVSCINNNRNWIATEISKVYIDDIITPRIISKQHDKILVLINYKIIEVSKKYLTTALRLLFALPTKAID